MMLKRTSLTARWFLNSFGAVAALLVIIDATAYFFLRSYYQGAVTQYLRTEANVIYGVFGYIGQSDADYRAAVESFDRKDQMELTVLNSDGRTSYTSSGFEPSDNTANMPDFEYVVSKTTENYIKEKNNFSEQVSGIYFGKTSANESYVSVCILLPDTENYIKSIIDASASTSDGTTTTSQSLSNMYDLSPDFPARPVAIRMITSLESVNKRIISMWLGIIAGSLGVMTVSILLGLYYTRSIVKPILNIRETAKKIAAGDFSAKLPNSKYDDEINALVNAFNGMADELAGAELIKNDFISSVSHELRTPLTAIRGWSDTLSERDILPETFERGLKIIREETDRLSEMVEELLDFSKLQSDRFTLNKEDLDFFAEAFEAALFYAEKAKHENINFTLSDIPENSSIVEGDRKRLRQVFVNVFDNALKYCDGEDVFVYASETREYVAVQVRDNGRGISKADLPRVKEKFFRAENAKNKNDNLPNASGSGIGLSVTDEIIRLHGGKLIIESELGKGTKVTIILKKKKG